jgi:DNA-binding MarR family transcriptional regulator
MTSDQHDLFSRAYARNSDPSTSHAAAASVDDIVTRMEFAVREGIVRTGGRGATWDELHALTGIDKASISPRFKPLREKGLIQWRTGEDGKVIKRSGHSGRGQIVWFAC